MQTASVCAQVARSLGEPLRLVERRGFQPVQKSKKLPGNKLAAVDCPFCGQQILVASSRDVGEVECRGCDVAFKASSDDVYAVSIDATVRPQARRLFHEIW